MSAVSICRFSVKAAPRGGRVLLSSRDGRCCMGVMGLLAFECKFAHAVSTSAYDADKSSHGANEGYFAGSPLPEVRKNGASHFYGTEEIGVELL